MVEPVSQYRNLPLGSVDVSVVATAERQDVAQIATLDRSLSVMGPRPPMVSNYCPSHIDRSMTTALVLEPRTSRSDGVGQFEEVGMMAGIP